jgi:glycosyltransferase involved in cell wall biosynthesis
MRFVIITHAEHKVKGTELFSYEPFVREMNLWGKHVSKIEIVAPISKEEINAIEITYDKECKLTAIPKFDITSVKNIFKSLLTIPLVFIAIYKAMKRADHIHLRCPGNIGLLGCIVQVLFPNTPKTAKYAGNWDPNSKQPWSYMLQKWILSNTFLTKKMKVLVYGEWPNQTKNIIPFFTATYSESELDKINVKPLDDVINFIFVGGLTKGKQPLLTVKVIHELSRKGIRVKCEIFGDGVERNRIEEYVAKHNLSKLVILHGNVIKNVVKEAFKRAHFLVFISKSEGWPKVVAEAMCLGCLPISTPVSCVPYMLDNGKRGSLVNVNIDEIVAEVELYIKNKEIYYSNVTEAYEWSSKYTLEKFENEIAILLQ